MTNSRLTLATHALCWLEYWWQQESVSVTSARLAESLSSNPVTIRKVLAGVRDAGLVRAGRGPGSGWRLAQPATDITLLDVYQALGEKGPFELHRNAPDYSCPVGGGVGESMERVYAAAERQMLLVLASVTISSLLDDILRVNQGGKSEVDSLLGHFASPLPHDLGRPVKLVN